MRTRVKWIWLSVLGKTINGDINQGQSEEGSETEWGRKRRSEGVHSQSSGFSQLDIEYGDYGKELELAGPSRIRMSLQCRGAYIHLWYIPFVRVSTLSDWISWVIIRTCIVKRLIQELYSELWFSPEPDTEKLNLNLYSSEPIRGVVLQALWIVESQKARSKTNKLNKRYAQKSESLKWITRVILLLYSFRSTSYLNARFESIAVALTPDDHLVFFFFFSSNQIIEIYTSTF